MAEKIPDASTDCPRCRYWERTAESRPDRVRFSRYPRGIDQQKALDLLVEAFPKSYKSR